MKTGMATSIGFIVGIRPQMLSDCLKSPDATGHATRDHPAQTTVAADGRAVRAPGLLRRRRPFLAPFWLAGFVVLASLALLYGVLRATIAFAGQTTTVIVLRHAEKASVPADDPSLTPAGEARAQRLRTLLGSNAVRAVYASEARRTQDTARPLASALSLPVTVHPARDPQGLLDAIGARPIGGTVVVVGHSNTVPDIVSRLTRGKTRVVLRDDEFDRIFIVTVTRFGPPSVVALQY